MFEKVRLTLWDIYTFFITGVVLWICVTLYILIFWNNLFYIANHEIIKIFLDFNPITLTIFILFIITGLAFEPFSNYLQRILLDKIFKALKKVTNYREKDIRERKVLEDKIIAYYVNETGINIDPYQIAKEYVDMKQINNSWMTFLSRFGFYRNLSSISFLSGVILIFEDLYFWQKIIFFTFSLFLSFIFYTRAKEFYSYMAPSIYRSFINDRFLK